MENETHQKCIAVNASCLVLSCLQVLGSVTFSFRISTILEICFTREGGGNVSPISYIARLLWRYEQFAYLWYLWI